MKSRFKSALLIGLSSGLLSLASTAAWADYFVRPYVQLGQGVIDGYVANGVTESSQNFTSDLQAQVSLDSGTIRNFLQITGPGTNGQSAGIMGDRLSFDNATGTTLKFRFDFDGSISAPARDPNLNSTLQIGLFASLYVFAAGSGATYRNFDSHPGALIGQTLYRPFNNPQEALEGLQVEEAMQGSFLVTAAGRQSYDVFYGLSIFASTNNNPGTVTMDFMNTARAAIDTAPGVSFTSSSGVFLGSGPTPPVPEPGTYVLMSLGLLGVVGAARRKRG